MNAFLPCLLSLLYVQIPAVEVREDAKPLPLTEIKFQAIRFDRKELVRSTGRVSVEYSASYGTFTSEGPKRDSMLPFPDDIRVRGLRYAVTDNKGERLYCLIDRDLHVFDISQRPMKQVEVPKTLPSKSLWGLAFDSKRDCVLTVQYLHGGLFAFDVNNSTSSKMNEIPLQFRWLFTHLTYDQHTDRLYGLHFGGPNHEDPIAVVHSPEGSVITSFAVTKDVIPPDSYAISRSRLQLVGSGGYVGLLTPDRLVLVEPETRKTHVCWQVR